MQAVLDSCFSGNKGEVQTYVDLIEIVWVHKGKSQEHFFLAQTVGLNASLSKPSSCVV